MARYGQMTRTRHIRIYPRERCVRLDESADWLPPLADYWRHGDFATDMREKARPFFPRATPVVFGFSSFGLRRSRALAVLENAGTGAHAGIVSPAAAFVRRSIGSEITPLFGGRYGEPQTGAAKPD
jgi:hypothetical protein